MVIIYSYKSIHGLLSPVLFHEDNLWVNESVLVQPLGN